MVCSKFSKAVLRIVGRLATISHLERQAAIVHYLAEDDEALGDHQSVDVP